MHRLGALAAATAWAVVGGLPSPGRPAVAAAQAEHRAAVVVDTGTQVKTVCVRFREESISGVEALARAAVEPVVRTFPGKGAAVCSLCGVGCPADESCLTCDPEGRFWSYSRAPAGSAALRPSAVGSSSTSVRDGDVEGWRWGLGATPAFVSVGQVCDGAAPVVTTTSTQAAAPPTTPPPPAPAGVTSTTASTAAGRSSRPPAMPALATAVPDPVAPAPSTASSTPPSTGAPADGAGDPAPAPQPGRGTPLAASRDATGGAGGWGGLAVLAGVLSGLVAWAVWVRRRRCSLPGEAR